MSQLPTRAAAAQAKLDETASTGIRASLRSVIISLALSVVKVISGVVGHSYALIADGVESMLDVVSGAIVAGSLKIAAQPPDEKYPFGYGKISNVFSTRFVCALMRVTRLVWSKWRFSTLRASCGLAPLSAVQHRSQTLYASTNVVCSHGGIAEE